MKFGIGRFSTVVMVAALAVTLGCGGSSKPSTSPTPGVSGVHSAYVANSASASISEYAVDDKGVLHEITGSPFTVSGNPTKLVMTPDGNFLYATDTAKNMIYEMSINSTTGVLTSIGSQASGTTPSAVAIDPKGKFLYVGNSGSNSFSVYAIGSDGKLTETAFSPVTVNGPVEGVNISPKGTYLFASVPSTSSIYEYTLDATTGTPTISSGSPMTVGTAPRFVAVSPNETFAIVLESGGTVNRLDIGSGGTLTLAANSPFTAGATPIQAIVDSTNSYVYVLSGTADAVVTIGFQTTGVPYQVGTVGVGKLPSQMAISGTYLYVANSSDNTVTEFSQSAGVATALSPTTVTTGTTPTSIAVR